MRTHPPPLEAPSPYSPVLHTGVAPDGLLHVSMALWGLAGPGPLPGLDGALGGVVAVTPLSTASSSAASAASSSTTAAASTATTSPYTPTASSGRWSGAEAAESVLAATLEVVLGAGEGHLHPDPGFPVSLILREGWGAGGEGGARGRWLFRDATQATMAAKVLAPLDTVSPRCCCGKAGALMHRGSDGVRSEILAESWREQARVQPLTWHTQSRRLLRLPSGDANLAVGSLSLRARKMHQGCRPEIIRKLVNSQQSPQTDLGMWQ